MARYWDRIKGQYVSQFVPLPLEFMQRQLEMEQKNVDDIRALNKDVGQLQINYVRDSQKAKNVAETVQNDFNNRAKEASDIVVHGGYEDLKRVKSQLVSLATEKNQILSPTGVGGMSDYDAKQYEAALKQENIDEWSPTDVNYYRQDLLNKYEQGYGLSPTGTTNHKPFSYYNVPKAVSYSQKAKDYGSQIETTIKDEQYDWTKGTGALNDWMVQYSKRTETLTPEKIKEDVEKAFDGDKDMQSNRDFYKKIYGEDLGEKVYQSQIDDAVKFAQGAYAKNDIKTGQDIKQQAGADRRAGAEYDRMLGVSSITKSLLGNLDLPKLDFVTLKTNMGNISNNLSNIDSQMKTIQVPSVIANSEIDYQLGISDDDVNTLIAQNPDKEGEIRTFARSINTLQSQKEVLTIQKSLYDAVINKVDYGEANDIKVAELLNLPNNEMFQVVYNDGKTEMLTGKDIVSRQRNSNSFVNTISDVNTTMRSAVGSGAGSPIVGSALTKYNQKKNELEQNAFKNEVSTFILPTDEKLGFDTYNRAMNSQLTVPSRILSMKDLSGKSGQEILEDANFDITKPFVGTNKLAFSSSSPVNIVTVKGIDKDGKEVVTSYTTYLGSDEKLTLKNSISNNYSALVPDKDSGVAPLQDDSTIIPKARDESQYYGILTVGEYDQMIGNIKPNGSGKVITDDYNVYTIKNISTKASEPLYVIEDRQGKRFKNILTGKDSFDTKNDVIETIGNIELELNRTGTTTGLISSGVVGKNQ